MAGDASSPHTSTPAAAIGTASRPLPTPSSSTAPSPARAATVGGHRVGVADVAVPLVVDVGERVAVGAGRVAVHQGIVAPPCVRAGWRAGRNDGDGRPMGRSGHPGGADAPAPAIASAAAPPAGPGATPATGVPPLRPLTIPDILDGALRTWKAAPATMVALAAAFVVPTQVLLGFLTREATEDLDIGGSFADAVASSGPEDVETGVGGDLFFLALLVEGLALAFVTVAVARVVTGWYTGHRLAFGGALTGSLRRSVAGGGGVAARPPGRGPLRHRPGGPAHRADDVVRRRQPRHRLRARRSDRGRCGARTGCAGGASARCSASAS